MVEGLGHVLHTDFVVGHWAAALHGSCLPQVAIGDSGIVGVVGFRVQGLGPRV